MCDSVTNTCVACNQASGCDPNSQAPICFESAAQRECVQCVSDEDCPDSLVCSTDRTCVACNTNVDCPATAPVCDQDLNICAECSGSSLLSASACFGTRSICLSQVLNFVEEEAARAVASAATDICVQCVNAANMNYTCSSNQVCASSGDLAYSCVQCTNDGDCNSEQRPYCDVAKGTCEQCFEGKPCPDPFVCDIDARVCRSCLTNSDCVAKGGPNKFCNANTYQCVGCLDDENCGTGSFCESNICIFGCNNDQDCTSAAYPHCDIDINQCVECQQDADCGSSSTKPFCDVTASRDQCVQCVTDAQCGVSLNPKCNTGDNTCVQCLTNLDCIERGLSLPVCNTVGNICQECLAASDCDGESHRACQSGTCVECDSDDQCQGSSPFCDTQSFTCKTCLRDDDCPFGICQDGKCVQCITSADCADDVNSVCDTERNTCVQCESDSDCPSFSPVCDRTNPFKVACVGCINDADCSDTSTPFCSLETQRCVSCITNDDCASPTPTCSNNQCVVECLSSEDCSDCIGRPTCQIETQTCVECLSSDQCCEESIPICNADSNSCVQCLVNNDCSPERPVCGADNRCYQCETDAECIGIGVCQDNSCVSCTDNQQCQVSSQTNPVCDVEDNDCVECTSSIQCSDPHPICNFFTKRCVECENSGGTHWIFTLFCGVLQQQENNIHATHPVMFWVFLQIVHWVPQYVSTTVISMIASNVAMMETVKTQKGRHAIQRPKSVCSVWMTQHAQILLRSVIRLP